MRITIDLRPPTVRRIPLAIGLLLTLLLGPAIALASHRFSDVPASSPYHGDIDAVADAGVTAGCGADKYCPEAFVTREQMAAFMNRLGALGPGKTPVVNADKLDGRSSAAFLPSAVYRISVSENLPMGAWAQLTPSCDVGDLVLSGGFALNDWVALESTLPFDDDTWLVEVRNTHAEFDASASAHALCADFPPYR